MSLAMLLLAGAVRIHMRSVNDRAMIHVRNMHGEIFDEVVDTRHVVVVDVLWLVRYLMVIGVESSSEEDDRNVVAGVFVVIATAVDVVRITVRVHRIVECE